MSDVTPFFSDEAMLAGWKETHSGGATVTFWLPDSAALEPFRGATVRKGNVAGQRFGMVLVEIGEDEKVVKQNPVIGPLCTLAVRWCKSPMFHRWLNEALSKAASGVHMSIIKNEVDARDWVIKHCAVSSRKDLDNNEVAARLFHSSIRRPYSGWLSARGIAE